MNYDVFISHSKDNKLAKSVYDYLLRNQVRCFLDTECLIPGELFTRHICEARESCSVVVLLLSRTSDGSTAVNGEINNLYKKKKVIPVRIEDFEPKNLAVFVGALQWLDAYILPFDQHLPKILSAVRHYIRTDDSGEMDSAKSYQVPEDIVNYLKICFAELALNYPSFEPNGERMTIGEHSLRVLRIFDKYSVFNKMIFPENIMARDKFMIVLALHDIGMAKVANRNNMKIKFDIARKSIQWLIKQPDFQGIYGFNAQEEQIALAIVSDEPIRRYLNNRTGNIACAEQIVDKAVRAGVEIDSAAFWYFFKLLTIFFLCDAGSYSKLAGGNGLYDFFFFDDANKEIYLTGQEKEKFNKLELTISKISSGAITFTAPVWKRTKVNYLNDYARGNIAKIRQGETLKDRYFQYRYNSKSSIYQISPLDSTRLPILYEPQY